jgi:Ni,Fe-hydrogenase III large subunit/Ni,Fe-hydrogenase III component G
MIKALAGMTPPHAHHPWPRRIVDADTWSALAAQLAEGRWTLAGLWGDAGTVHMALLDMGQGDRGQGELVVASLACPTGQFPSVARHHPPAHRLERTVNDLFGLEPVGAPDDRPWLDHGRWRLDHPLGISTETSGEGEPYVFLTAEGEGLHRIGVGPVHAGIIEPGHFRFTANGETVVRLEERLGYTHKGVESLMTGASPEHAARLAGRISGDSTVAYSIAFARAVETALGIEIPARAHWLRALMAELERIANHVGDIGAACNDAAFALIHAHTAVLRERVLRQSSASFGHRLMMDKIMPGGVAIDLDRAGAEGIRSLMATIRQAFPPLVELFDNTASLQDRTVGTGILSHAIARQYGCGGYVGRASGRAFDTRRDLAYPPYDSLRFDVPLFQEGDVNARLWVRIREVEQSLEIIDQLLEGMPPGEISVAIVRATETCEGIALVEGFRGDILCWLRLAPTGIVERCHLRDPSWFQWPVLEAAIEGNIVADFPLCNKSFNCSYSGHDL